MNEEKINEAIFDYFFGGAVGDATKRTNCGTVEIMDIVREKTRDTMKKFLDELLKGAFKGQDEYDEKFKEITTQICDDIKKEKVLDFTFGNAQKLVNMLTKNAYQICYSNKELKEKFRYCHCPMDSKMLNVVWKEWKKEWKENPSLVDKNYLGRSDDFKAAWSTKEYDFTGKGKTEPRYVIFQNAVRKLAEKEEISALEFDYIHWNKDDTQN